MRRWQALDEVWTSERANTVQIKVWVATNKVGSRSEDIIDVPDDATEEEIEKAACEAMLNMIIWNFDWVE
jgi:hypothetical protein